MLSLKVKQVTFNHRTILENIELNFQKGLINTLIGESGSGKTTLINTLTFKNEFASEYTIHQEDMCQLTPNQKDEYVFLNFGVVYQNPQLIEGLTLKQHIELVKSVTQSAIDEKEWLELLELEDKLSLYPNRLSGGEQVRVAVLLAILKDPEVLILDEPTSSLDDYYTNRIMKVIQSFSRSNRIVIISTHDEKMIVQSDCVYAIKDKTIQTIKEIGYCESNKQAIKHQKPLIKGMGKKLFQTCKHDRIYKKTIAFITAFAIALSSYSVEFNNAMKAIYDQGTQTLSSNEFIIYRSIPGSTSEFWGVTDSFELIEDEVIDSVNEIEGIEEIRPRVDLTMDGMLIFVEEQIVNPTDGAIYPIFLETKEGVQVERVIDISLESGLDEDGYRMVSPNLHTYFKDKDYDDDILVKFQDEGIYLSKDLANFISNDNIDLLEGAIITCDLYIPVYNSHGYVWTWITTPEEPYFLMRTTCERVKVSLPVAGVLKTQKMGSIIDALEYSIFVEDNILNSYMEQYHVEQSRVVYDLGNRQYMINQKPEDEGKIAYTIIEEPWTARSYSVFVDDMDKLNDILKQITDLGLNVYHPEIEAFAPENKLEISTTSLQFACFGINTIVALVYIALKYNNLTEEKNINLFLKDLGLNLNQIKRIKSEKNIFHMLSTLGMSLVMILLIVGLTNGFGYGFTKISGFMVVIALGQSFLIEWVIPMLFEGKNSYVEIK